MNRVRFEASLAFVLKWEGSRFTNDPDDHGGATRFGIIQREYNAFRQRRGLPARSVEFITMDEVREIYQREYWERVQGDVLTVPLDVTMFDTGVLMGVGRAIQFLQRALNVRGSGVIDQATRTALASADAHDVAVQISDLREARLRSIVERNPTQRRFLRGWLNRLNDLRQVISQNGLLSEVDGAYADEELTPDEEIPVGRALADLSDDFPEEANLQEEEKQPGISFFETLGIMEFARQTTSLSEISQRPRYVIDVSASDEDVFVVSPGLSGSSYFELPASALEAVTPLGLSGGDPNKIVAAFYFRPEFQRLAAILNRPGAAAQFGPSPDGEDYAGASGFGASEFYAAGVAALNYATGDDDPASPQLGELRAETSIDPATARTLANYGAIEPDSSQPAMTVELEAIEGLGTDAARLSAERTLPLDISIARAFLDSCIRSSPRIRYGLGAKIPFHGAKPAVNFTKVDCSGFAREVIWRATTPHLNFPDGSVVQHDWVRTQGFARSTPEAALLRDGAVRIAFLRPQDSPSRIGHIALVHNARTIESHGGVGPNSRDWTRTNWQARAVVYILSPPTA